MPSPKFGDKTTWLRGKLGHTGTVDVYFDLYKCERISKLNANDYLLVANGETVELIDCVVREDLEEIKPPEG